MNYLLSYFKALFIALITVVFSLTVIIAMLIFGKKIFHPFARIWSKLLLIISGIKVIAEYSDKYKDILNDKNHNVVFAANHSSFFDIPVILSTAGKNSNIIYKKSLEKTPIWGWGLKMSPFIAVDRDSGRNSMAAIEDAIDKIKSGDSIIIFPEGTRTTTGKMGEFKRGAFMMAARSGLSIIPVAIEGTFPLLKFDPFQIKGGIVSITYGTPLVVEAEGAIGEKKAMTETHSKITEMLSKLSKQ